MPSCKCGAAVTIAQTEGGDKLVLEAYSEPIGADRFAIINYGADPVVVAPIDGSSPIDGYSNHKVRCPFQP